jgi:flagellar protein FlaG
MEIDMSISAIPGGGDRIPLPAGQTGSGMPVAPQTQRPPAPKSEISTVAAVPVKRERPVESTSAAASPAQPASSDDLKRATQELQRRISLMAPELQFSVDEESGRSIIKVTDPVTKEVIRQIPSEQALKLNQALDQFRGLLVNRKA